MAESACARARQPSGSTVTRACLALARAASKGILPKKTASRTTSRIASALQKIHNYARGIPMAAAERHPETAQMMIVNPLSGGGLRGMFSTHPSMEERVARLLAMRVG